MLKKIITTAIIIASLAGCSQNKVIDASTAQSLEKSVKAMTADMSDEEKRQINMKIAAIWLPAKIASKEKNFDARHLPIHGKTADEILALP